MIRAEKIGAGYALFHLMLGCYLVWKIGYDLASVWKKWGLGDSTLPLIVVGALWLASWWGLLKIKRGYLVYQLWIVPWLFYEMVAVSKPLWWLLFILAAGTWLWWLRAGFSDPTGYPVLVCRLCLGWLFIYAAHDKILDPYLFALAMINYDLWPYQLINISALMLPWLELLAGLGLIFGVRVRLMAFLIGGMVAWFIFAIVVNIFRGNSFDCGCGVPGDDELGWGVVWRDIYMVLMAMCIVLFDNGRFRVGRLLRRA